MYLVLAGESRHAGSTAPLLGALQRAEQVGNVATRVLHSRGGRLRRSRLPQGRLAAAAKRHAILATALKTDEREPSFSVEILMLLANMWHVYSTTSIRRFSSALLL